MIAPAPGHLTRSLRFAFAISISLMPSVALGQTGLGSPAGGGIVILIAGALALIGLAISATGGILLWRGGSSLGRITLLGSGLALMSPALWLSIQFALLWLRDEFPSNESWDFSASRSVAVLNPEKRQSVDRDDHDSEYTFGSIRSIIRLPGNRQWPGLASRAYIEAKAGEVISVNWNGRHANTDQVFQEAKGILRDLRLADTGLDSWYAKARSGGTDWFSTELQGEPQIRVDIRRIPTGGDAISLEKTPWYVSVDLIWKIVVK
jgi:hypothetical protein